MTDTTKNNNTSFNEKFCSQLEFHSCRAFEKSDRQDIKGFWCDGVSWTPTLDGQLGKKNVNDKRKIVTKAWLGKDGQSEYEMTIYFGQYSLSRYAKGTQLTDCIPSEDTMDWIEINPAKKVIEIKLR